jgi:HTH-type transcriptional regulator / antitoxin HigA
MEYKTPGQLIEGLLKERGWTQRVLAVVLGVDETGVNRLVADKRSVDATMALALEEVFEVPAERFLELQRMYDLAMARITARPDPTRATRARLYGDLPVSDMIKRGWVVAKDVRDTSVEPELLRFFGTNRVEDIEILPHAAKKTQVSEPATPAQMAWLYRVKRIASEMLVGRFSQQNAEALVPKLKQLLLSPEGVRKVPRLFAEAGIRFLIVETLPGAKIDGVCFWLNERSPVVALTMRFDRIDNFWFVLRHELEHVLREHGKAKSGFMLDAELDTSADDLTLPNDEKIANEAAAEFCVPKKMMDAFYVRKAPFFHDRDILAFAKMINVHPGLIAGQIRRRTSRYDRFGNYLVKVRNSVLPSAVSDGWGSVYPVE